MPDPLVCPKRPEGKFYTPHFVKGLKWERKIIRNIALALEAMIVPMKNEPLTPRRDVLQALSKISFFPNRPVVCGELLYAIQLILAYNDELAVIALRFIADVRYKTYIKKVKELKKLKSK